MHFSCWLKIDRNPGRLSRAVRIKCLVVLTMSQYPPDKGPWVQDYSPLTRIDTLQFSLKIHFDFNLKTKTWYYSLYVHIEMQLINILYFIWKIHMEWEYYILNIFTENHNMLKDILNDLPKKQLNFYKCVSHSFHIKFFYIYIYIQKPIVFLSIMHFLHCRLFTIDFIKSQLPICVDK